jgi:thiamine monophosphate synthase
MKRADGTKSAVVFFLCEGEETPMRELAKSCRNNSAAVKIAKAIESVDEIGITASRVLKRLKPLRGTSDNDLYEITTKGCTARAYTFLIDGEAAIAIAHIKEKTHSGKGNKDIRMAIAKLNGMRPLLEEALRGRSNNGTQI